MIRIYCDACGRRMHDHEANYAQATHEGTYSLDAAEGIGRVRVPVKLSVDVSQPAGQRPDHLCWSCLASVVRALVPEPEADDEPDDDRVGATPAEDQP